MREHIINEATKLFVQYGLKAIRMDDIATQLGVSKRTIYEIFGDKETLILECLTHYHHEQQQRKIKITEQATNVIEGFILFFQNLEEEEMEENYKLMANLRKFYPNVYQKISERHTEEGYEILRKKLQEGVDGGYLVKNVNYELAISVFSYSIFGIISNQKAILPNNVSEKEAFVYVVTYFIRGIATEKGRKLIDEYLEKNII